MFSSKFIATVYAAVLCAGGVAAVSPAHLSSRQVRHIGRGLAVEAYHPTSTFETFGVAGAAFSKRVDSAEDAAVAIVQDRTGVSADAIGVTSTAMTETGSVTFVEQKHKGIKFANSVANVALNRAGRVTAFGSSFVKPSKIASSSPSISKGDAISAAEEALGGKYNGATVGLEYFVKEDDTAVLTHVVQVQDDATDAWFEAFVDAATGDLVSVTDFVSHATFRVVPIYLQDQTAGIETIVDPEDDYSSPYGWLSFDGVNFNTTTSGNNVIAANKTAAPETAPGEFVYDYKVGEDPLPLPQVYAATVNAFYVVNSIHDITYKYGFTEATYNFQQTNIRSGGVGNDRVTVSVQDGAGFNNANFATPADGTSGRMRMYLWNKSTPWRDGSMNTDIVAHELMHGVSNRMTGGGTGRCLQTYEAGGMGEGWSDTLANWLARTSATNRDFFLAAYTNGGKGLRHYPYSTSKEVNPLKYSDLPKLTLPSGDPSVHYIGEAWANTLHNVYYALVSKYGFDINALTNPELKTGNTVFLHLMLDALLLQPCNPSFLSARSAWIQADANRYGGVNKCLLWEQFASRGLGVDAANYTDSFDVPAECAGTSSSSAPSSSTASSTTVSSTISSTIVSSTESSTASSTTSSTASSSSVPAPTPTGCTIPTKCPVDLTGATGVLITNKSTLWTCAYSTGSCTWWKPAGNLRNTEQPNCPKTVTC